MGSSLKTQRSNLDARVVLHDAVRGGVGVPVGASVGDRVNVLEGVDLILPLNHLEGETLVRVPCNVA